MSRLLGRDYINFALPYELKSRAQAIADVCGVPLSAVCRELVVGFVAGRYKLPEGFAQEYKADLSASRSDVAFARERKKLQRSMGRKLGRPFRKGFSK